MKYFVIVMYTLWIGLTLFFYFKERFDENNTDNNR